MSLGEVSHDYSSNAIAEIDQSGEGAVGNANTVGIADLSQQPWALRESSVHSGAPRRSIICAIGVLPITDHLVNFT